QTDTQDEKGNIVQNRTVYQGLVTTQINPLKREKRDTRNPLGQLIETRDAKQGLTLFARDAWGNLTQTTDPTGNLIGIDYDRLGRKTELRDPDLGRIEYKTDPLGQVWQQISPKQRLAAASMADGDKWKAYTNYRFDLLGRQITRLEPDLVSHWRYDSAAMGIGQLHQSYTCQGGTDISANCPREYVRTHSYDSLGRPAAVTTQLFNGSNGSFISTPSYDNWGRLAQEQHQHSNTSTTFEHRYNAYGYLKQIGRNNSTVLWKAQQQDAANRVIQAQLGNGLQLNRRYNDYTGRLDTSSLQAGAITRLQESYNYDLLGNVSQRSQYWDGSEGFSEVFDYDELNRLKLSQVAGQAQQVFTYDSIGNLTSKTGVGTGSYNYPVPGPNAIRPHAVRSIGSYGTFYYDDNGNLESIAKANGQNNQLLKWTSFDMPASLSKGSNKSTFVYGPDHQRTKQVKDGADTGTTWYAGAMELETANGDTLQYKRLKTYWPMGLGVEVNTFGNPAEQSWTHSDRLGSLVAITGADGSLKDKLAYDAWGKRRNLNGSG
ncbi:hypothetical protein QWZ03_13270, partial [Chitinimonas viridis]